MYAGVYEDAKKRGDAALQQQLAESYLKYSDTMLPTQSSSQNKRSATSQSKFSCCMAIN